MLIVNFKRNLNKLTKHIIIWKGKNRANSLIERNISKIKIINSIRDNSIIDNNSKCISKSRDYHLILILWVF